jgi:hypothetical protein
MLRRKNTLGGRFKIKVEKACTWLATIDAAALAYPPSNRYHDAKCEIRGDVQVKITAGDYVSLRGACNHLIVLQIISPHEAAIVFDGPATGIWEDAGKTASNGQRRISLAKLRRLAATN